MSLFQLITLLGLISNGPGLWGCLCGEVSFTVVLEIEAGLRAQVHNAKDLHAMGGSSRAKHTQSAIILLASKPIMKEAWGAAGDMAHASQ